MSADAAKNALESIFNKTKDVVNTAADVTKGYAAQAQQAIGKILPSQLSQAGGEPPANGDATTGSASQDPNATAATAQQ